MPGGRRERYRKMSFVNENISEEVSGKTHVSSRLLIGTRQLDTHFDVNARD